MSIRKVPTVKTCIKRLAGISIQELQKLSTRDLNNILKLNNLAGPINLTLAERIKGAAQRYVHQPRENYVQRCEEAQSGL